MYKGRIAEETVNPNGFDKEGFLKQRYKNASPFRKGRRK